MKTEEPTKTFALDSNPQTLHGIWRVVPSPSLTEILAQGGLDFQILDCEHGAYDYQTLQADMTACALHQCQPFVRVSGRDKVEVQRVLDLGARGVVFPQLSSVEEFANAAAMMDHWPKGTRGFNPFVRTYKYGQAGGTAVVDRPWFVPIIETLEAVELLDRILEIERIDMIYVGSYDLSAQLGCAGKMDTPELIAVVDRIFDVAQARGIRVGMMALSTPKGRALMDGGIGAIVHGVESHRILESISNIVGSVRD